MVLQINPRLVISGVLALAPISKLITDLRQRFANITRCPRLIPSYRVYHLVFVKEQGGLAIPYVATESGELAQATFPVFSGEIEDPDLKTKMEFSLPKWAKEEIQEQFLTANAAKLLVVECCKIFDNEDILYAVYAVRVESAEKELEIESNQTTLKQLCKRSNKMYFNSISFLDSVF